MSRSVALRASMRFGVALLLLLATVAVTAAAATLLRVLDAREQLNDRVNPAQILVESHLLALVDQETGLRAYLVVDDAAFLDSYEEGVAIADDAVAELEGLLDEGQAAQFAEVTTAVEAWQVVFVQPVLDGADVGRRALLIDGKAAFDDVRAASDELREMLRVEDQHVRERLDESTIELVVILGVVAAMLLLGGIAGWVVYRRLIESPLVALGADADRVASGDLRHPIEEVGPEEVRELARVMEAMRSRIIEEVTLVEEARVALESQAADLARSNAELEQFAYVASHDLQEPLRKVASFCQLLEQRYGGQLDERADQYIQFAVDGAKRMQVLIQDLLAFSRVGRLSADLAPIDLDVALDRALDNLSTVIDETGATITRDDLPVVQGDASLLVALFQNLVANAVKFRRDGVAPAVVIASRLLDGEVEVEVRDNGIGIDAEHAERVFVIFQRLHGRDLYEGTGIGLALCRKIVEHHGGHIEVDSDPSAEGAIIRFTLPLADQPAPDPQGTA